MKSPNHPYVSCTKSEIDLEDVEDDEIDSMKMMKLIWKMLRVGDVEGFRVGEV